MPLAKRIIPSLLHHGTVLIKGQRFDGWRSVGHVQQAARIHAARGVDELLILDIGASKEHRGPNIDLIRQLTDNNFIPVTVGGGITCVEEVKAVLNAGADKVAIGTGLRDLDEMKLISERYGKQALVAVVDVNARGRPVVWPDFEAAVWDFTMKQPATKMGVVEFAVQCATFAGEIVLTAVDREGTMLGYDLDLIRLVTEAVDIPVIAHGGCSGYEDMLNAIKAGASAVAAGALFQFTDSTPRGAALYLAEHGIEVRL